MGPEGDITVGETNRLLDRELWRDMRKPLAAGALAVVSFFVGNHIDNTHQAHADQLSAEVQAGYDALPPSDEAVVKTYLSGGELPKGTAQPVVDEAHELADVSNEQRREEHAGSLWTVIGGLAGLYAGAKIAATGLSRTIYRHEIRRRHPDLAAERVNDHTKELTSFGAIIERDDSLRQKYGWEDNLNHRRFKQHLREVGQDIELAEQFTPSRQALDQLLVEMLNTAQMDSFKIRPGEGDTGHFDPVEALQIRIANDLWQPTETFSSLEDWYSYRKKQIIEPNAYRQVNAQDLYLPELKSVNGGVGVALSRITEHWQTYVYYRHADRDQASEAMMCATVGAATLDELIPRDDGSKWHDYATSLVAGDSASVHN